MKSALGRMQWLVVLIVKSLERTFLNINKLYKRRTWKCEVATYLILWHTMEIPSTKRQVTVSGM